MMRILIILLVIGLSGCKESVTGLDKRVLNAAYDNCEEKLESVLKSPSSLRISNAAADNHMPQSQTIYDLYSKKILSDKTNKITEMHEDSKSRFRALNISLSYEAQNSFGVYLPGSFSCTYIYELREESKSPSDLDLIQIQNSDGVVAFKGLPISIENASSYILNGNIQKISSSVGSFFSENDKKMNVDFEKSRLNEVRENSEPKITKRMKDYEIAALEAEVAAAEARAVMESMRN